MASTEGLMPITREFLARYYDKYTLAPLSEDVSRLSAELRSKSNDLTKELPITKDEVVLVQEADSSPPHKVDQNMWKNREHIEEVLYLLESSHCPRQLQQQLTPEEIKLAALLEEIKVKLQKTLKLLEFFQSKNSEIVFSTVMTYMPQDFRGTIIRQQRERSERNKQAEVDALFNSGASIHDRYALLWAQQMERRRQLAQLGSATGVYKTLVKYLVGVPQVLLDFIKQINDDHGPMEEQRHRYGPSIYSLTTMVTSIHLFLLLSWGRYDSRKLSEDELAVFVEAVHVYTSEMERFIKFLGEVFANSPFFIPASEVGTTGPSQADDYKETIIPVGKTYEVSLSVDSVNSYIAWDFSLIQGKLSLDIGFSVEFISPSGEKTMILPYRRYESDQGNFCTIMAGCYKLIWDNSYSSFFKKSLRYKVDAIPPVVEPEQPLAEVEG